eukprot:TRINITY_DN9677_c0_g1_i2.p1 TRINITY_DN9677_c0_g1~~TRINITY_DN9677_c0_g1_i2.p1  ORF type:complete len:196 (-),score=32.36 TRINITY_DN9677_c0_g1_i2:61-618(-)
MAARIQIPAKGFGAEFGSLVTRVEEERRNLADAKTIRLLTTNADGPGAAEVAAQLPQLLDKGFQVKILFSSVTDRTAARRALAPYAAELGSDDTRDAVRFATFKRAAQLYPMLLVGAHDLSFDECEEALATQNYAAAVADQGAVMTFDYLFDASPRPSAQFLMPKTSLVSQIFSSTAVRRLRFGA